MAPPALAIVGGVVVVAGMTVAFHHVSSSIMVHSSVLLANGLPSRTLFRSLSTNRILLLSLKYWLRIGLKNVVRLDVAWLQLFQPRSIRTTMADYQ